MKKLFFVFLGVVIASSFVCTGNLAHTSVHLAMSQNCCEEEVQISMTSDFILCEHCLQTQNFPSDDKIKNVVKDSLLIPHVPIFPTKEISFVDQISHVHFPQWYYETFLKQKSSIVLRS